MAETTMQVSKVSVRRHLCFFSFLQVIVDALLLVIWLLSSRLQTPQSFACHSLTGFRLSFTDRLLYHSQLYCISRFLQQMQCACYSLLFAPCTHTWFSHPQHLCNFFIMLVGLINGWLVYSSSRVKEETVSEAGTSPRLMCFMDSNDDLDDVCDVLIAALQNDYLKVGMRRNETKRLWLRIEYM